MSDQSNPSKSAPGANCAELWFVVGCLLVACCGAGYLAGISIMGAGQAGCGPGSGCNLVLSSRWAYWLGVPVSVPAFGLYAALLGLTVALVRGAAKPPQELIWAAVVCLSFVVVGACIWFVLLQIFVVKAFCKFCLGTHLSAMTAAVVLLVSHSRVAGLRSFKTPLPAIRNRWGSAVCAVVAVGVLVAGQVAVRKQLYTVSRLSGSSRLDPNQMNLHGGKFRLNPSELPGWGSVSATNGIRLISLFDYTCSHCRALHPLLREVPRNYPGRLAIVALPVPLEAGCNPLIQATAPANQNACEYARLSLAVWHVRREAFADFDNWLFASSTPPPIEQARSKAQELVGKEALAAALEGPWVEQQLKQDVSLYQANARAVRDAHLPQLNIGDVIAHGAIESREDLFHLIEQGFSGIARSGSTQ